MTIKLQGKWEAKRVARIVEMWNPANEDLVPWRDDVVERMRRQIDRQEKLKTVKRKCATCKYLVGANTLTLNCIKHECEVQPDTTLCGMWRMK